MLTVEVNLDKATAAAGIEALKAALENKTDLHGAMTDAVETGVRGHLHGLNSRSPNTGFYDTAAKSVTPGFNAEYGQVLITARGAALRYYGGRVTAGAKPSSLTGKPTKYLALPTSNVPVVNRMRLRPKDVENLVFIPNRSGPGGYLVEGETYTPKRGAHKGKQRLKAKPKGTGKLYFILREFTDHKEDLSILPPVEALTRAAGDAANHYIDSFT